MTITVDVEIETYANSLEKIYVTYRVYTTFCFVTSHKNESKKKSSLRSEKIEMDFKQNAKQFSSSSKWIKTVR